MTLRQKLGCLAHERWRTELVLRFPEVAAKLGLSWLDLCNRNEELIVERKTGLRICNWQDSSTLTVNKVFPEVGKQLMDHCFRRWPVDFNFSDETITSPAPDVSVIIPTGGTDRAPIFWLSLASMRAQRHVSFEILVIEQAPKSHMKRHLPPDVRYRHIEPIAKKPEFNKSWALNVGAKSARGRNIMIHDADYIYPNDFLKTALSDLAGSDAIRPARLIFYLDKESTISIIKNKRLATNLHAEKVVQNNPTPLLLRTKTYWEVGGHDERYFGWGGEDSEFLSRLRLKNMREGGRLPAIHLWHANAPKKQTGDRNKALHEKIMEVNAAERIANLKAMNLGGVYPQA